MITLNPNKLVQEPVVKFYLAIPIPWNCFSLSILLYQKAYYIGYYPVYFWPKKAWQEICMAIMNGICGLWFSRPVQKNRVSTFVVVSGVQRVDSTIYWINHRPLDNSIGFGGTYPIDSDISTK